MAKSARLESVGSSIGIQLIWSTEGFFVRWIEEKGTAHLLDTSFYYGTPGGEACFTTVSCSVVHF